MNWRFTLAFYKVKIRNSPISDICICLKPLQRCLWCPVNNPLLVGNPATMLRKKEKLKGIFKHQSPGASALKKKIVQNDLPSVSLSPLKGEIAVMSLTFFAVLPESCLVRRRKDEHGSHLSWNVEILLRLKIRFDIKSDIESNLNQIVPHCIHFPEWGRLW